MSQPVLPTVAETLNHPSYSTAIWNLEPTQKGILPVAEGRGGPLNISWEVHGSGPVKLVLITGLASLKSAWQRQTLYFGHERGDQYSVLVLDNRGMGDSDKPLMRYSTSEMAQDLLEVLAHLGWVSSSSSCSPSPPSPRAAASADGRRIHVAGISMGGMIAQELALLVPDAISSLTLICTAAAIENTTTFFENMANRASMLLPQSLEATVRSGAKRLFPQEWLVGPDDMRLPDPDAGIPGVGPPLGAPTTSKKAAAGGPSSTSSTSSPTTYGRFGCRYQRYVAEDLHKRLDPDRFKIKGFLLQLVAAGWHHKSPEQLRALGDRVGRERILVMHGTQDLTISVPHGHKLIRLLQPAEGLIVEGMGHAPIIERVAWFNGVFEKMIGVGEQLDGR
ncbi:hypothetical protein VTK73DRAFT_1514 [Phialemonium thermophilum]|uniref:AB hydrolase-1 domain-containing protein n=1 Tax=Phialemonium thermophilum TaxID=223376 RepID=A0ABR3VTC8_9PEZI